MKTYLAMMVAGLVAMAGHAAAQDGHAGHEMPMETSATAVKTDSESTKAFKDSDAKMHKAMMAAGYTGDADVDFLRNMIPHHEGAVEMAKVVLKYGTDPDVRMLAGDIIKAQDKEIRWMKEWLWKHGPKDMPVNPEPLNNDAKASDVRVDATPAVAVPVAALVVSGSTVSPTVPAADVSGTTAASDMESPETQKANVAIVTDSGMSIPAELMPEMPAPEEAIDNSAPAMELINQ